MRQRAAHSARRKNTIVAVKALHHAIFNPGAEIAVLSRSLKDAGHLLTVFSNFAEKIGYARKRVHGHDHSLHLPNGEAGLLYNIWRAKGRTGWHRVHATVAVAPFATPAFLAEKGRLFPRTFPQDFFCDFNSEQGRFISREVIDAAFCGKNIAQLHPVPSGSRIPL